MKKFYLAHLLFFLVFCYCHYAFFIKMREYPEENCFTLESPCYMAKFCRITRSFFLNLVYDQPSFYKIFDKKTQKPLYTSNIFDRPDAVCSDIRLWKSTFYSEDCTRFSPPPELCTPWKKIQSMFSDRETP